MEGGGSLKGGARKGQAGEEGKRVKGQLEEVRERHLLWLASTSADLSHEER